MMHPAIRLLVLLGLLGVIASLGSALYHLSRGSAGGEEHSAKLARALTVRIALSLLLFALLMLAWYFGLISPHTLEGGGAAPRP
ncbi:MAG TPA: twin transmembrane helix small protein [Steroidobacteraceae bacterium]|nr:twin transmembrane helix small protein [Steroidobacteraceae bacterium]